MTSASMPVMAAIHRSTRAAGLVMAKAFSIAPNVKSTARAAMSVRRVSLPMPDRRLVSLSSSPGRRVMRAMLSCGHACTQSRHNVQSRFPTFDGQEQGELAASLHDGDGAGHRGVRLPASLDAVHRATGSAGTDVAHSQLRRRQHGRHEIELPDRAHVLAEARARKQHVDHERDGEIGDHEPRRGTRKAPEVEQLVGEEHPREQDDGRPFVRKARGQRKAGCANRRPASRTRIIGQPGAEQVPDRKERDYQQASVVDPAEDRRQIARSDGGPVKTVCHDDDRDKQQWKLQQESSIAGDGPALQPPASAADP